MLTCAEATRLASDALDRPLTGPQRLRLRVHLLLCSACRKFAKQLHWLQAASAHYTDHPEFSAAEPTLSDAARQRIQSALDKESNRP